MMSELQESTVAAIGRTHFVLELISVQAVLRPALFLTAYKNLTNYRTGVGGLHEIVQMQIMRTQCKRFI